MTDRTFRSLIGFICIAGGLLGLFGLYFIEVPAGNKEALLLALGVVLGWGAAVNQSEFGSTSSGRNLAAQNAEIVKASAATPTGTPADPISVEEVQP